MTPAAPLLSNGAPMAIVLPSLLRAIEFPVCPWFPPPQAKWSYASAFDALRYATCTSGSVGGVLGGYSGG